MKQTDTQVTHTRLHTHTHLLNGRMSETKGEGRVQEEVRENEDRKLKKEARVQLKEFHRLVGRLTWGLSFPPCVSEAQSAQVTWKCSSLRDL